MDFSKQLQKAAEAQQRRNWDFAVELYRQLLDIEPDLGEARAGLRQALKKRAEAGGGSKLLRALGGALPLSKARALEKLGKWDACAKALEDYLLGNPLDAEANLLLGRALEEGRHFRSARAAYEFAAELAPRDPEALKRAGAMMRRTGDLARALDYYERALQADPRDQEAHKARKDLAAESAIARTGIESAGHSRELIKDKQRAAELERGRRLHLSDEELAAEVAKLEARFAEDPTDVDVMIELAALHEKRRDLEAALELAERALSYRRDSYELAARAGELRVRALKRRLAKAGESRDEARAAELESEIAAAEVADARARLALRPGESALRLLLGRRLLEAGAVDEALGELQHAAADARQSGEALALLGAAFARKGLVDLAREHWSRALEAAAPRSEHAKEILYNLGALAEAEHDSAAARSHYLQIYACDIGYRDVAEKINRLKPS
jgi:tetratricopeptide (TPR) repeat protein